MDIEYSGVVCAAHEVCVLIQLWESSCETTGRSVNTHCSRGVFNLIWDKSGFNFWENSASPFRLRHLVHL